MKNIIQLVLVLCSSAVFSQRVLPEKQTLFKLVPAISAKNYLPGVLIVKFKATPYNSQRLPTVKSTLDTNILRIAIKSVLITSVKKKFADSPPVTTQQEQTGLNRIYEVRFAGNAPIETVIKELLEDKRIEYAEPSYVYHRS